MNHWAFVIAAYVLTLAGTVLVSLASWRGMSRAEADAERLTDRS